MSNRPAALIVLSFVAVIALVAVGVAWLLRETNDDTPAAVQRTPSAGATASATPPPGSVTAGPSATASGTASATPPSIPGVETVALKPGTQASIGYGTIVYYSEGCFGCGRPDVPSLFRAYRESSGTLKTDDLFASVLAKVPGAYPHSFAARWELNDFVVAMCTGYCGGEGDAQPGSTLRLFHSRDGGITWTEDAAKLPVTTFLAGFVGDEVLAIAYDSPTAKPRYVELPSARDLQPPAGAGDVEVVAMGAPGVAWMRKEVGGGLVDGSGREIFAGIPGMRLARVTPLQTGWFALYANETGMLGVVYDGTGKAVRVLSWGESRYLDIDGQIPSGQLVANVELADTFGFGADAGSAVCKQQQHIYAALINWGTTATVHPISDLGDCPNGRHRFVNAIVARETVRVVTGTDCLNVRATASTTGEIRGCFADGVLLQRRLEGVTPVAGWVAVLTPSGQDGWVSEAFVK
ncbi:MAG: hypothetical protein IT302_12390 [Dehalococcoidia bacterium]|nr:hypothetical protein [Dehalococcoidia bacterium]